MMIQKHSGWTETKTVYVGKIRILVIIVVTALFFFYTL
jgi:hypothetical protein